MHDARCNENEGACGSPQECSARRRLEHEMQTVAVRPLKMMLKKSPQGSCVHLTVADDSDLLDPGTVVCKDGFARVV